MSDCDELLLAVHRRPYDDLPRLVYADAVEEVDPERAEFIRLQVALARLGSLPFASCRSFAVNMRPHERCGRCVPCQDMNRAAGLLGRHAAEWAGDWIGERVAAFRAFGEVLFRRKNTAPTLADIEVTFHRGFVNAIRCHLGDLFGPSCSACRGFGTVDPHRGDFRRCTTCQGQPLSGNTARVVFARHPVTRFAPADMIVHPSGGNDTYYLGGLGRFPSQYWRRLDNHPSRAAVWFAASDAGVDWGRKLAGLPTLTRPSP